MKRITLDVSDELHKDLSISSAALEETIRQFLIEAAQDRLKKMKPAVRLELQKVA